MNFMQVVYEISRIAKLAGQVNDYKMWSDEAHVKEVRETFSRLAPRMKEIDWTKFSEEELHALGFGNWDGSGICLIPIYLIDFLPDGLELTSIDGDKSVVGKDHIDNDTRFGCLAYGIYSKLPQAIGTTEFA